MLPKPTRPPSTVQPAGPIAKFVMFVMLVNVLFLPVLMYRAMQRSREAVAQDASLGVELGIPQTAEYDDFNLDPDLGLDDLEL